MQVNSDQLSLVSLRGRLIEYQLRLGKGGNVTSAGWQVTLCDPMWHVSARSGVATLRTAIHLLHLLLMQFDSKCFDYQTHFSADAHSTYRGNRPVPILGVQAVKVVATFWQPNMKDGCKILV